MSSLLVKTLEPVETEQDGRRKIVPIGSIIGLGRAEAFKLSAAGAVEICAEVVDPAAPVEAPAPAAVDEPVADETTSKSQRKGR